MFPISFCLKLIKLQQNTSECLNSINVELITSTQDKKPKFESFFPREKSFSILRKNFRRQEIEREKNRKIGAYAVFGVL